MTTIDVEVDSSGPLFDGRAAHIIAALLTAARADVAQQGYANVMTILNQRIRHPTPYYETQIITQRVGETNIVHDRGVVYGPWLEGVGSRNRTTRFKGYAAFRRGAEELRQDVPRLVEGTVARHVEELR